MAGTSKRGLNSEEIVSLLEAVKIVENCEESDDNLSAEEMYDSDEGKEYIPNIPSESENDLSDEEINPRKPKRRRTHGFSGFPPTTSQPGPSGIVPPGNQPAPPAPGNQPAPGIQPAPPGNQPSSQDSHPACTLLNFNKSLLHGRSMYRWSTEPIAAKASRTAKLNICETGTIGPKGAAIRAKSSTECLQLLIDDRMLEEVVNHTNAFITVASLNYGDSAFH